MGTHLVRELWGQTYHEAVTAATAKLDNVLPDDLRQEVASTRQSLVVGGLTAMDYRSMDPTIHLLRQCTLERRRVRLLYRDTSGIETERELSPYGLTLQWGLWYVVGWCHLRDELRTFRVDRIRRAERLDERFEMPTDFSVRDYLHRSMRFEPTHHVVLEVDSRTAARVREQHGRWMEVVEDDSVDGALVRFATANPDWAVGWVLSLGPAARVLEPPEIVERVRMAAKGILQRYEGE
ncbi:MAG: helix-turn-helix transcriptional regulator, partial [Anaerolineae bacterium]|jgi:predicted DNA-binding transcriptional regulator YafY